MPKNTHSLSAAIQTPFMRGLVRVRGEISFADSLGVDLVDIRQPFGEDIAWHFISKFVSKFSRFALCSSY